MDRKKFIKLMLEQCHLTIDRPLVAGISGGPDSLCMLDLLDKSGIEVIAVHLNHQLRQEAEEEASMVSDYCKKNGIKCIIGKKDIPAYAKEKKLSVEESARILRYQFLFEQAEKMNAQAVLVAHNADDQAETVLMHLLRGSGLSGLKGMQMHSIQKMWSDTIPLVRPLLKTSRAEILEYCQENQLSPAVDLSNNDSKYFRNRIRQTLLPELSSYNPRIKEHLVNMADVAGYEDELLCEQTKAAWDSSKIKYGDGYVLFSRKKINGLHPALQRRLLRLAIQIIDPGLRDIDFGVIERASNFIESQGRVNHLLLLADVEIIKDGQERLIVCDQNNPLTEFWPQLLSDVLKDLNLSGTTELGGGWQIQCQRSECPPRFSRDGMTCSLDASRIDTLFLDTFKPGDRFSPFSLKGKSIKISDFWTKNGLPERARWRWPLIKNNEGEIVWVPGFQISDAYKITPETNEIFSMTISRIEKPD